MQESSRQDGMLTLLPSSEIGEKRTRWPQMGRKWTAASSFDTAPPTTAGQGLGRKIDKEGQRGASERPNLSHCGTLFALGSL
jgi:hypothetical protein